MIRTKISSIIFYTIVWSMCAISINSYNWDWSESEEKRPKQTLFAVYAALLWYINLIFVLELGRFQRSDYDVLQIECVV